MQKRILGFFGPYRFLSNFHTNEGTTIYIDDLDGGKISCPDVERAFQASKTFDRNERLSVANATSPGESKKMGYKVTLRPDWQTVKNDVMLELLIQKFTHPFYKELLLATGDAELIEDNTWNDTYWGMCEGVGENHLGRMLMQIREALKQ